MSRVGFALLGALGALALLAPALAAHDPAAVDAGPVLAAPSWGYPMGTDGFGRDVWSRWLYGARLSLAVGAAVMVLATTLGAGLGALAGAAGGWVDRAVNFVIDGLLVLPRIVVVLAVVGALRAHGPENLVWLVVLLGGTSWMGLARLVRAEVMSLAARPFVHAAVSVGLPPWRVWLGHVLPHTTPYLGVFGASAVGYAILAEAGLSYLGFGVAPPTPSWGAMVAEGMDLIRRAPWLAGFPGLGITLAVVALHAVADGLRDHLDPRLSRTEGGGPSTGQAAIE